MKSITFLCVLILTPITALAQKDPYCFYTAVEWQGIKELMQCLESGADIHLKRERGIRHNYSPLMLALSNGKIELAKFLIKHGARFIPETESDDYFWTNLAATKTSRKSKPIPIFALPAIELLLKGGMDINYLGPKSGDTILGAAVRANNILLAKSLIERGAIVNLTNQRLETPLHIASSKGDVEMIKMLIEKKADFKLKNQNQQTPLAILTRYGRLDAMDVLLKAGAELNIIETLRVSGRDDSDSGFLLMLGSGMSVDTDSLTRLASNGRWQVVRKAIERGSTPSRATLKSIVSFRSNARKSTAWEFDQAEYSLTINKIIAALSQEDINNELFFDIIRGDDPHAIAEFIKRGADPNWQTSYQMSAVGAAASWNCPEALQALIDSGADIDARSYDKSTALMMAVQSQIELIVKLLLKAGAKTDLKDSSNKTATDYASQRGNRAILELLEKHGVSLGNSDLAYSHALLRAARSGDCQELETIVKKLSSADLQTESGETPLGQATMFNHVECMRILLKYGANPELQFGYRCQDRMVNLAAAPKRDLSENSQVTLHGEEKIIPSTNTLVLEKLPCKTPLMIAAASGYREALGLLLSHAAQPNARAAGDGSSALIFAARHGDPWIVDKLLSKGANLHIQDGKGKTALENARENQNTRAMEIIFRYLNGSR